MLTPHGRREWGLATLVAAVLCAVAVWLGWWWLIVVALLGWIAVIGFFRDPPRRLRSDLAPGDLVSPADGRVSKVFSLPQHAATGGPAVVIRIFLSVLDVHINRVPCDGEILSLTHVPGRYLDARSEESARVNESNLIVMRRTDGRTIGVRQVSGAIARRIVCPVRVGDRVQRGARFGMIKFGSTTELIVPEISGLIVHVCEGDRVRGALTLLATLPTVDSAAHAR